MRISLRYGWLLFALLASSLVAPIAHAVPVDPATLSGRILHLRADANVYTDIGGTSVAANNNPVRYWGDQSISNSPATNGVVGMSVLPERMHPNSVLSQARLFKRCAMKGAMSKDVHQVTWLVGELDGVKVYVKQDGLRLHIVMTRQELYP